LASFIAIPIGYYYFMTKNWVTNNIFGECFSIVSIELISLQSFQVGCVLLIGLFFYDIFWVFGTDVMVTVAKSFEAPIKVK
jgi:minor histocompatibility antigen H13